MTERGIVTRAETAEQECTRLTRELLKADQVWRSERALREMVQQERDKAVAEVEKLRREKSEAIARNETAWSQIREEAKSYGGSI